MTSRGGVKESEYTRYPLSSLLIYNGTTVLHYLFGGFGIMLGYNFSWPASLLGVLYIALAFIQMYILMPLLVCPNCVYYKLEDSLCISGLNIVAKKVSPEGSLKDFAKRGEGLLCHNHMYMGAKIVPVLAMLPGLFLNFSMALLVIFLVVVGLLVFRIFVIFLKVACVHCRDKDLCPNAKSMGLSRR
jgi:hypothetical protein